MVAFCFAVIPCPSDWLRDNVHHALERVNGSAVFETNELRAERQRSAQFERPLPQQRLELVLSDTGAGALTRNLPLGVAAPRTTASPISAICDSNPSAQKQPYLP
ncbi:hypothetical protein ABENE_18345 [Asticcacaulis benevestitus DSM 16100 = ATCC BAA-896]|uniref:Uncharacterized protein n=1 Tax=Asticcacaulis benevestitus DSM 16100 = ATCC BAA-896 TaxID=1121022 RepID=V4PGZ3_9CAUL|nr:hypothetical protein ABENE_18345 [Asticcacaulis benevestitus DSM 16100 = ATCC BAA-896]